VQVGWARDAALTAAIATIRGVDVRASWVPLSSPGTYQLSYLVPTHDALLVGSPPTLVLQLADPRYVDRVSLMQLCRASSWCHGFAANNPSLPLPVRQIP
jgi:hypothetical protein